VNDEGEATAGQRWRSLDAGAVAIAIAVIALLQSWNRWFDPIVDAGRDLYISEQLARGERLYRDIRYQYPPLTPYLLAGVTRFFGSSLRTFACVGIAESLAVGALLLVAARRLAGRGAALAVALMFFSMNFTGASTFGSNFVIPYSYAATTGMLFLLLFFTAAAGEAVTPPALSGVPGAPRPAADRLRAAVAIAAALVASWCKVEYAVAVVITMAVLVAVRRFRVRDALSFVIAGALTMTAALLYFGGAWWLRDDVLSASLTRGAAAQRFFASVAGTASWPDRLGDIGVGCVAIAAIILTLRMRRFRWIAVVVAVVAGAAIPINAFFRAWGLLQWIAIVWALLRDRRDLLVVLAAFSIASTLRIPLNVAPWWYGFVLVVPTYLLIVYVVFQYLPAQGLYDRNAAAIWLVVFAMFAWRSLADKRLRFSVKQFPVTTIRGTFYDANEVRAAVFRDLLPRVRGTTLAVMPEGIGLNYLAAAPTTLTYYTFIPPETADPRVEQAIIGELARHPPQHIVFLRRSVAEFGYRGFGVDYDQRLVAWIHAHYSVVQAWPGPRFELVLLRWAE
jgi:hypothetical protein